MTRTRLVWATVLLAPGCMFADSAEQASNSGGDPSVVQFEGTNCRTLDFDTDAHGSQILPAAVLRQQYAAAGIHIASWRDSSRAAPSNAVAFDGTSPTGGDDDLFFPDLGNVLISHERAYDPAAETVAEPDDDAGGAFFELSFDAETCVNGLTALDVDNDEDPVAITYLDAHGGVIDTASIGITGGNGRGSVARQVCGVFAVTIELSSSGAIDDVRVCDSDGGLSGAGLGEPINIDFGPDSTIIAVLAVIREEFLEPGTIEESFLDMTITSIDGTDHFHGTDIIPLTDVTVFSQAGELVNVVVDWTEDNEPEVVGDVYTVCSTLLTGAEIGPERCQSFGPF